MALITVLDDYQGVALPAPTGPRCRPRTPSRSSRTTSRTAPRSCAGSPTATSSSRCASARRSGGRARPAAGPAAAGHDRDGERLDRPRRGGAPRVTVCGTGGSGNAMPELTIGMMIALTRNFAQEDAAVRAGGWQHTIGPGLPGRPWGSSGWAVSASRSRPWPTPWG